MTDYRWLIYALISAIAASLVAIFGKVGLSGSSGIDSTVATTIRSLVMSSFLIAILVLSGLGSNLPLFVDGHCFGLVHLGLQVLFRGSFILKLFKLEVSPRLLR